MPKASELDKLVNGNGETYTVEWIPVTELEVDPRIQRFNLDLRKVERFKKAYNPDALGVATVSRRNQVTNIVLDGWHRLQLVKEMTDSTGKLLCHVYEGLSRSQEAQIFLDLNAGNQPNQLEKFQARLIAEDPVALAVNELVHSYGWVVHPSAADHHIQAIGTLERIYRRSLAAEQDPNQLQVALLVVTRAWDHDRFAAQAVILEGIGALYGAHSDKLEIDRLVDKLREYPKGPLGLHSDATQVAKVRRGQVSMAVAELATDQYNRGKTTKSLPVWRKRKP